MSLVLSLFPGIGLLDMAFEAEGFCVVRGPDLLWGGDVHNFHPPAGRFDGVIGGPPCKRWSSLAAIVRAVHGEESLAPDLIPEFARVVLEAQPQWFLMENVPRAPGPVTPGYGQSRQMLNNRWCGGVQNRTRVFTFGTRHRRAPILHFPESALEPADWEPAVTSSSGGRRRSIKIGGNGKPKGKQAWSLEKSKGISLAKATELQGLPVGFLEGTPFTALGKREMVANGVPLPMGRAVAQAVKAAIEHGAREAG